MDASSHDLVKQKHKYYVTRIALDQFQHIKSEPEYMEASHQLITNKRTWSTADLLFTAMSQLGH
jgi:hypothetical protein